MEFTKEQLDTLISVVNCALNDPTDAHDKAHLRTAYNTLVNRRLDFFNANDVNNISFTPDGGCYLCGWHRKNHRRNELTGLLECP